MRTTRTRPRKTVVQLQTPEGSSGSNSGYAIGVNILNVVDRFDICVRVPLDGDKDEVLQQLNAVTTHLMAIWDTLAAPACEARGGAVEKPATPPLGSQIGAPAVCISELNDHDMLVIVRDRLDA